MKYRIVIPVLIVLILTPFVVGGKSTGPFQTYIYNIPGSVTSVSKGIRAGLPVSAQFSSSDTNGVPLWYNRYGDVLTDADGKFVIRDTTGYRNYYSSASYESTPKVWRIMVIDGHDTAYSSPFPDSISARTEIYGKPTGCASENPTPTVEQNTYPVQKVTLP